MGKKTALLSENQTAFLLEYKLGRCVYSENKLAVLNHREGGLSFCHIRCNVHNF